MKKYISSQFADKCEKALSEALSASGLSLTNRAINGYEEKYVHAGISGTNLEIFIYFDGACIFGPGVDLRFELPDYHSEFEIINHIIKKALVAVNDKTASKQFISA